MLFFKIILCQPVDILSCGHYNQDINFKFLLRDMSTG